MDDLTIDWKDSLCKLELHEATPCSQEYEHVEIESKYLRFYFHYRAIIIRIPRRLALWMSAWCDCISVALSDIHVICHYRDNTP